MSTWYGESMGKKGQYFHEHVILSGVLKLLNLKSGDSLLDLGCGEGILGRGIPKGVSYTGYDIAPDLIRIARQKDRAHTYQVYDVTGSLPDGIYSHAAIILALQNIEDPEKVIGNAAKLLKPGGSFVIVMNHPCFRIPRQSGWGIDDANKLQYRKIFRYMSPLSIPISMHPGKKQSPVTWTFHRPLSDYFSMLRDAGLFVDAFHEWTSDKESVGKDGNMENRARKEIPLFLALRAVKRL